MQSYTVFLLIVILMSLPGCDKSGHEVTPVRGTVTIDGKPLANASIMFAPEVNGLDINSGKPAFGQLDADGHFILSTYRNGDGAIVGQHTVTISRRLEPAANESISAGKMTGPNFRSVVVPGRFRVVAEKDNVIDIAVTSEELSRIARYNN